ncbi:MAG TPA: glycosyltransferase, partial [Chryseosolibacter sp.]|nr:glycosyltransferase [Chryseosolibacter sp.]
MRILHVIPSYKPAYIYAGVIESASRLCEGLVEAGHSVHVFTTTANGTTELDVLPGKEHDVDGVKVIYFKRITKDPTNASPGLWSYLFRHCREYDAVHLHTWWNILVIASAWICIMRRVKVIITPEGMLCNYIFTATHAQTKKWIHQFIGRRALSKTIFHATAESEYKECKQLIPGWKGFLLPNILLLPDVSGYRVKNTVFTLIFLSRIHP